MEFKVSLVLESVPLTTGLCCCLSVYMYLDPELLATVLSTSLRARFVIERPVDSFVKLGIGHRKITPGNNFKGKEMKFFLTV